MNPLTFYPTLSVGCHAPHGSEACAMEQVAVWAGEPWSDTPTCVDPVCTGAVSGLNDALSPKARDEQLAPLLIHLIGTAGTWNDTERRLYLLAEWCIRRGGVKALREMGRRMLRVDNRKDALVMSYCAAELAVRKGRKGAEMLTLLRRGLIPLGPCAKAEECLV